VILDSRDEAQRAAATAAGWIQETMSPIVNAVVEQIRGLRAGAENELKAAVSKSTAEVSGLVSEIRTAKDAAQASANRAAEAERRSAELDREQRIREEGMRATWMKIAGFKKTFDRQTSRMRGAAVEEAGTETGEGEE
jgi:predicted  nucleic acid-binding Zn-ribbon protein